MDKPYSNSNPYETQRNIQTRQHDQHNYPERFRSPDNVNQPSHITYGGVEYIKHENPNDKLSTKDWVSYISLFIGIGSAILSYYFYASSVEEKSLSIILDKEVTPIIETMKMQSKKFSVVDTDGKKIEGNISAFKVKIVNDGDLPIRKSDVLDPLKISFINNETVEVNIDGKVGNFYKTIDVLDYFIVNSGRKEATKPTVEIAQEQYSKRFGEVVDSKKNHIYTEFTVDFAILESSDEINITVIFSGSEMPYGYIVKGAIEGIKKIQKKDPL